MRFFLKNCIAWVEVWEGSEWQQSTEAKLIVFGSSCYIDFIYTPFRYREKGHATFLVNQLRERFWKVTPISVLDSAVGFWNKLGMADALGDPEIF